MWLSLAALAVACGGNGDADRSGTGAGPKRPNVLMIVIDTLRADHLHCYGYPRETSPNIDALAEESVFFTSASTAWPETAPAMAALFTGNYCKTNGVLRACPHPLPEENITLSEILGQEGYHTGAVVTNAVLSTEFLFDQGFDSYHEVWNLTEDAAAIAGDVPNRDKVTTLATHFLEQHRDSERPFFLWAHYTDPHAPYSPPSQYSAPFLNDSHFDPDTKVEVRGEDRKWDAVGGFPGFSRLGDHDVLGHYVAQYDGEIRASDEAIGNLLQAVDDLGLREDTLVILTADHGEGLGEHNYYWHGRFPYDTCVHVPLMMRLPGVAPTRVPNAVSLVDVVPTLLDALDLEPRPLQGESLFPVIQDPESAWDRLVFTESGDADDYQRAIRSQEWKLIFIPSETERRLLDAQKFELYRIEEDPGETEEVSDDYPRVVEGLRTRLFQWMAEATDTPEAPDIEMTPEMRANIDALGYATGGADDE